MIWESICSCSIQQRSPQGLALLLLLVKIGIFGYLYCLSNTFYLTLAQSNIVITMPVVCRLRCGLQLFKMKPPLKSLSLFQSNFLGMILGRSSNNLMPKGSELVLLGTVEFPCVCINCNNTTDHTVLHAVFHCMYYNVLRRRLWSAILGVLGTSVYLNLIRKWCKCQCFELISVIISEMNGCDETQTLFLNYKYPSVRVNNVRYS